MIIDYKAGGTGTDGKRIAVLDVVDHPVLGRGVVLEILQDGDATVRFRRIPNRTVSVKWHTLRKVNEEPTPAEHQKRLFIAFDQAWNDDVPDMFRQLVDAGFRQFKISPMWALSEPDGLAAMRDAQVDLFLDAKLYDTRDTVMRTVRQTIALGMKYLTVHHTRVMAALNGLHANSPLKIIAVGKLSDDSPRGSDGWGSHLAWTVGIPQEVSLVIPAGWFMSTTNTAHHNIDAHEVFAVGNRLAVVDFTNDHATTGTPDIVAKHARYLIVGRPITASIEPVTAALEWVQAIASAGASAKADRQRTKPPYA